MNIEPLESRIAPAGVVTITVAGQDIKIVGDGASNDFTFSGHSADGLLTEIGFPAAFHFHIQANAGTLLAFNAQSATSFDIPVAALRNLTLDLGAGADELALENVTLSGKLEIKGGAGSNTVNLGGNFEIGGAFSYLGSDEADSIFGTMTSFSAASVLVDLKGGANQCKWTMAEFDALKGVKVSGGSGDDTVEFSSTSARLGGLSFDLGGGSNYLPIEFVIGTVNGVVSVKGGGGSDEFSLTATNDLTLRKGITANLGGGTGDFQLAAGGNLSVRGATTVNFGDAVDGQTDPNSARIGGRNINVGPLNFSAGQDSRIDSLIIAGYEAATGVTADNPAQNITLSSLKTVGANAVVLNATNTIAVRDSVNIYSNNMGSGLLGVVSLTAAGVDIGKDLLFTGGAGDAEFTLAADSISIGGKLLLNLGDTATHEIRQMLAEKGSHQTVNLGLPGGSLSAGIVLLASKSEVSIETLDIMASGRIETTGGFTIMDGGGSANVQFTDANLDIGKTFTVDLGAGNSTVLMSGGSLRADSAVFKSAAIALDWEVISMEYEEVTFNFFSVQGGAGASNFALGADTGHIGVALFNLGAGANIADLHSGGGLKVGKLGYLSGSGAAALVDKLTLDGIAAKELKLAMGDAASRVAIINSRLGSLAVGTRGGGDVLTVDDTVVLGQTFIDMGIEVENDETHIESDTSAGGPSIFGGKFTLKLGKGDDVFSVATAATQTRARFFGAVEVDGGDGTDTFAPHATNAVFATAPVLINVP